MTVGCISHYISSYAYYNSSEAINTTDVVPSPTSLSYYKLRSTIILATGCSTSIFLSIVAPSLVIVTSPISSTNSLSKP